MDCQCAGMTTTAATIGDVLGQHPVATSVGALGALLMLAALAWRLRLLPRLAAGLGLYSRLARRDITKAPSRASILACIEREPGVPTARLQQMLGMNAGTLEYHLGVLAREGVVKPLSWGRTRVWFAAGARPDERAHVLAQPARARLADAVRARPGATLHELARGSGLARSTVHEHLAALADAGVVQKRHEGLRVRYYA